MSGSSAIISLLSKETERGQDQKSSH